MSFRQEIEKWDGKSVSDIGDIYSRHCQENSFVSNIIEFISDGSLQNGATWMLKRHLENNHKLNESETTAIYKNLDDLVHWESKLHVLQCLPYLLIPKPDKSGVETFLRNCLMDENKFVGAWAYNGFYELSVQYPEYAEETRQFFEMAMRDEAPSVQSRIRNILKKGF